MNISSNAAKLCDLNTFEPFVDYSCCVGAVLLSGRKNLDLPHMGVSAAVLVLKNSNLNKHGLDKLIFRGPQLKAIPANRLFEFNHLNLLKLLKTILNFDRNFLRSV